MLQHTHACVWIGEGHEKHKTPLLKRQVQLVQEGHVRSGHVTSRQVAYLIPLVVVTLLELYPSVSVLPSPRRPDAELLSASLADVDIPGIRFIVCSPGHRADEIGRQEG